MAVFTFCSEVSFASSSVNLPGDRYLHPLDEEAKRLQKVFPHQPRSRHDHVHSGREFPRSQCSYDPSSLHRRAASSTSLAVNTSRRPLSPCCRVHSPSCRTPLPSSPSSSRVSLPPTSAPSTSTSTRSETRRSSRRPAGRPISSGSASSRLSGLSHSSSPSSFRSSMSS